MQTRLPPMEAFTDPSARGARARPMLRAVRRVALAAAGQASCLCFWAGEPPYPHHSSSLIANRLIACGSICCTLRADG